MDQPGKVANPARGQLNRENNIPLSPCVPENLVSSRVPREEVLCLQPLIPPKRFDIFPPITGGCSEGLGVF